MSAFLYAQSDGYAVNRDRIMGRQIAGRGFLAAYLRQFHAEEIGILVPASSEIAAIEAFSRETAGPDIRLAVADDLGDARIARAGAVSFFDVSKLVESSWRRRQRGAHLSLTGLTHSISDPLSADLVGSLIQCPIAEHDALICTSRAIRAAVTAMFDSAEAYLSERFGASRRVTRPQLPVIPLGMDLPAPDDGALRSRWRAKLGIAENDVVALFFGRIAFHAKAHPLPMYVGLQEAAASSGQRVHLIQAGWFPNDAIEAMFREAAQKLAPAIVHHVLDGRQDEVRSGIWHAADFFTSLSDTIEESFGLTPIEAMAAGLPCVVSDWDGYRDTIRDGETGFLVPSFMPPPGAGAEIARLHAEGVLDFDAYEGFAGLAIAVDVAQAAEAYRSLITDPARRRAMGAAARTHVAAHFAWPVVIPQHRDLWAELAARRAVATPEAASAPPLRQDPYLTFAGHASAQLHPDLRLRCRRLDRASLDTVAALHMNI